MLRKISICLIFMLAIVSLGVKADTGSNLFEKKEIGSYDWQKSVVKAVGFGIAPSYINNSAQSKILAREAAITTAQRRLLEIIKGVRIDSKQLVKNAQLQSDMIEKRVSGLLKGAKIIEEKKIDDKTYKVVMKVSFYGQNGVMKAILPSLQEESNHQVDLGEELKEQEVENDLVQESYTGIIINAAHLDLKPALAPKIYDKNRNLVYGIDKINTDQVITNGIVSYSRSLADAKNNPRVGSNPLVVHAQRSKGEYKTDLILSTNDATRVKQVGRQGIFAQCRVVIVLN